MAPAEKIWGAWLVLTAVKRPGLEISPFSHLEKEITQHMILWNQLREDCVKSRRGKSQSVMTQTSQSAPSSAQKPPLSIARLNNGAGIFPN